MSERYNVIVKIILVFFLLIVLGITYYARINLNNEINSQVETLERHTKTVEVPTIVSSVEPNVTPTKEPISVTERPRASEAMPTTKVELWERRVITNPYFFEDGRPKEYLTLWFDSKGEKGSLSLEHIHIGTIIYPCGEVENGFIPFYWTDINRESKIYWVLEKYCKEIE